MIHDDSYTEFDYKGKWITGLLMSVIIILSAYVH